MKKIRIITVEICKEEMCARLCDENFTTLIISGDEDHENLEGENENVALFCFMKWKETFNRGYKSFSSILLPYSPFQKQFFKILVLKLQTRMC